MIEFMQTDVLDRAVRRACSPGQAQASAALAAASRLLARVRWVG